MNQSGEQDRQPPHSMTRAQAKMIRRLAWRVEALEQALELVCDDDQMLWLYRNRSERMDPSVGFFKPDRVRFHLARYDFACRFVRDQRVADIACGTGYGAEILLMQGQARSYLGIDICPQTVAYACSRHSCAGAEFCCRDGQSTALEEATFDCVVSFETIEHVPSDERLITEFHRILKPEGLLICSTPNAWPLQIAPHHVREYDRESFLNALTRGFDVEQLFNQNSGSDFQFNRDQPEGIIPTTDENHELAECFLAVARKSSDRATA